MKVIATLLKTSNSEWRVRIAPRKLTDGITEVPLIEKWHPPDSPPDEMVLMYNPVISIIVRNRWETSKSGSIPIHLMYALLSKLSVMHNSLNKKGLFTKSGNDLFLDAKLADEVATKLACYRDTFIFYPVVMHLKSGENVQGVRIVSNGQPLVDMRHDEIRELCEVLEHTDIQVFSLIATMLDKMLSMDQKLDRIMETQAQILYLLQQQGMDKVKMPQAQTYVSGGYMQNGLNWQPVP